MVGLFRHFFQMKLSQEWYSCSTRAKRPELLVKFWDSIKRWKEKFFFCESGGIGGLDGGNEVVGIGEDDRLYPGHRRV